MPFRSPASAAAVLLTVAVLAGGPVIDAGAARPPGRGDLAASAAAPDVRLPPVNAGADYQLGGDYPLPSGVTVVSRDRTGRPAPHAYNICYVNAFQTQDYQRKWWKRHHPSLLLRNHGKLVHDPGWPAELLLDTSTVSKRRGIAAVIGRWFDGCARDGFDAVEPDNLDSFTRSHHLLTRADALALSTLFARRAHADGLAIAQKNLAGLSRAARLRTGFDFAVSEECSVWHECGSYQRAYGNHVIEIEYTDNGRKAYHRACRNHGDRWSIMLRDRMLVTPASPRYFFAKC